MVELLYKGKKTKEEILKRAYDINVANYNNHNSMIIKGDNFKALSLLLQNGYENKIDLVYIDPPFSTNIDFLIGKTKNNAVSMSKNGVLAYSDKLSNDDFLEFLRERIVLIYQLLSPRGSLYLHIDTKIGHYIKIILDEIFGRDNFINDITRRKSNPKNFNRHAYGNEKDVIYFYAKNRKENIWNEIKEPFSKEEIKRNFKKIDEKGNRYTTVSLTAPGESNGETGSKWHGVYPPEGRHWSKSLKQLDALNEEKMIEWSTTGNPRLIKYADDNKGKKIQDIWLNYKDPARPDYPTQKNLNMLEMIVKQSSTEDSIVLDAFAGSGNTLIAAQKLGRKFIGIDQSDVSIKTICNRIETCDKSIDYLAV